MEISTQANKTAELYGYKNALHLIRAVRKYLKKDYARVEDIPMAEILETNELRIKSKT